MSEELVKARHRLLLELRKGLGVTPGRLNDLKLAELQLFGVETVPEAWAALKEALADLATYDQTHRWEAAHTALNLDGNLEPELVARRRNIAERRGITMKSATSFESNALKTLAEVISAVVARKDATFRLVAECWQLAEIVSGQGGDDSARRLITTVPLADNDAYPRIWLLEELKKGKGATLDRLNSLEAAKLELLGAVTGAKALDILQSALADMKEIAPVKQSEAVYTALNPDQVLDGTSTNQRRLQLAAKRGVWSTSQYTLERQSINRFSTFVYAVIRRNYRTSRLAYVRSLLEREIGTLSP